MSSGLGKFATVLQSTVQIHAFKYIKELVKLMTEEAKSIIDEQRYNWKPLSDGYAAYKEHKGLDSRTLIATSFYRDHIGWGVAGDKIWWGVPNIIHEPSGLPLPILARIHEFGTDLIPARPLWRPLLSKYMRQDTQFAKRYRKELAKAVAHEKEKLAHTSEGKARKVKISY